jgi:hypothetical protein
MIAMRDIRTCRLCGQQEFADEMLKYGVRQYAHFECFAKHKTVADLERLPRWMQQQFEAWFKETKLLARRPVGGTTEHDQ